MKKVEIEVFKMCIHLSNDPEPRIAVYDLSKYLS
jgi:hypothetical protein